jgi:hypothetical protein
MSISAANPNGFSYLSPCLVEAANKNLPTGQWGDGLCSTYGGNASSNRTAIAEGFRSQYADENFLWNVSTVYVSRLPLGHSFGTFPAPGGARSSASHFAPLRGLGSSQNKFENHGKRCRANFFWAPPRKQTYGLGSRAHSPPSRSINTLLSSTHPPTMWWTRRSTMSSRRTTTFRTF